MTRWDPAPAFGGQTRLGALVGKLHMPGGPFLLCHHSSYCSRKFLLFSALARGAYTMAPFIKVPKVTDSPSFLWTIRAESSRHRARNRRKPRTASVPESV